MKDWYITGKNYGLMVKEGTEVQNIDREDGYFFSSDTSGTYASARPVISIVYKNQTGLEDYQTYSTHSIGNIDANINNYNGNLVLTHDSASTPGNRLPVSINHVYNTNDKETDIGYGKGYRLNLNQYIDLDGQYLRYTDEDGTKHWFYKDGDIYKDEDGLNLTISVGNYQYIMEDKEGNKSYFNKSTEMKWFLKEIVDTNGNKITINYSWNYTQITSVEDPSGATLTLNYNNNKLSSITDTDNRIVNYGYNGDNLTSITYPNNELTRLEYNNNKVTKIIDSDGIYHIQSAKSNNKVVFDVPGGSTDNVVVMQVWAYPGYQFNNGTYKIEKNTDGTFTIKTRPTNYTKCIDIYKAIKNPSKKNLLVLAAWILLFSKISKLGKIGKTVLKALKKTPKVKYTKVVENANKFNHVFNKKQHKLDQLLKKFKGDQTKTFNAVYNATFNHIKSKKLLGNSKLR